MNRLGVMSNVGFGMRDGEFSVSAARVLIRTVNLEL
jgi:hypothetical protein